jgi:hypothetical protein
VTRKVVASQTPTSSVDAASPAHPAASSTAAS